MSAATWIALMLMMQAAPPVAPPVAPKPGAIVVGYTWLSRPTAEDMDRTYPAKAAKENRSGAATLKCAFAADGRLRNCRVIAEQPEGYGFGDAALRLFPRFRMNMSRSPHPPEGATMVQSVSYSVPGQTEAIRMKLKPGEAASLITVVEGVTAKDAVTVACASPSAPARRCQLHALDWAAMPPSARSDALLSSSDQHEGMSLMECKVAGTGELEGCKVGGASERNQAALLELSKDFRAPLTAVDGTSTAGGRVVLKFDWKLMADLKAPLPGEPPRPTPPAPGH